MEASKEQHIAALKKAVDAGDIRAANEIAAYLDAKFPDESPQPNSDTIKQAEPIENVGPPVDDVPTLEGQQVPIKKGDTWDEFTEPVKAIAGGLGGSAVGGWKGIGELLSGGDLDTAVEKLREAQKAFANMPETEAGKRGLQVVTGALKNLEDVGNYFAAGAAGLSSLVTNPMGGLQGAQQEVKRVRDDGISNYLADGTLERTGSPLAATTASMLPDLAEIALGSKAVNAGIKSAISRTPTPMLGKKGSIADKLRNEPNHQSTAGYDLINKDVPSPKSTALVPTGGAVEKMVNAGDAVYDAITQLEVNPKGTIEKGVSKVDDFLRNAARNKERVIKNPLEKEALTQGWGADKIALLKTSTAATKNKTLQMLNMMENIKNNAKYGGKNRPNDIIGQSIQDRLNVILAANRSAGSKIDGIAKSLKDVSADYDVPVRGFLENLENMGVNLIDELQAKTPLNKSTPPAVWDRIFEGSDIEMVGGAEKILKNIMIRMSKTDSPNGYDMHRLKKYIDEQVSWGKTSEGLTGKAEIIIKELRHGINSALQDASPAYARVNKTYSETIEVLNQLQNSVSGKKIDFESIAATRKLGNETRKIQSNYNTFADLLDSLDAVDKTAKKYKKTPSFSTGLSTNTTPGAKIDTPDFDDDLVELAQLSEELNRRFGTTARTSHEATIEKGVNRGNQELGQIMSESNLQTGARWTGKAADKLKGVNDENAFKSMRELLKQPTKN